MQKGSSHGRKWLGQGQSSGPGEKEFEYQCIGRFQINWTVGGRINKWMLKCAAKKSTKVMSIRCYFSTGGDSYSVEISTGRRVNESKCFVADCYDTVL